MDRIAPISQCLQNETGTAMIMQQCVLSLPVPAGVKWRLREVVGPFGLWIKYRGEVPGVPRRRAARAPPPSGPEARRERANSSPDRSQFPARRLDRSQSPAPKGEGNPRRRSEANPAPPGAERTRACKKGAPSFGNIRSLARPEKATLEKNAPERSQSPRSERSQSPAASEANPRRPSGPGESASGSPRCVSVRDGAGISPTSDRPRPGVSKSTRYHRKWAARRSPNPRRGANLPAGPIGPGRGSRASNGPTTLQDGVGDRLGGVDLEWGLPGGGGSERGRSFVSPPSDDHPDGRSLGIPEGHSRRSPSGPSLSSSR